MKIPVILAMKGAVVRTAFLAFAVTLAALVQPLHSLEAFALVPTEATIAAPALSTASAAHRHDDCDPAPKPAAALCAVACAATIAVLSSPFAFLRPERLTEPAARQPSLRRGRHHPPDPRPPRPAA